MSIGVMTSSSATTELDERSEEQQADARRRVAVATLITIAALAPVVVAVLRLWGWHALPTQDFAVIDLRVRDVFSFGGNFPLTGPYSRFGWNHPGPISYYLLAAFSAPFGRSPWAILVGSALLQGVAIAWTARLAWKSGGLRWLVAWTAVVVLAYGATGPWIYLQAWNPHIVFPFFALFLLQCWRVVTGHPAQLLGLAFVGSFLVQTHIGYAVLVLVVAVWVAIRLLIDTPPWTILRARSVWLWPTVVLAVMWFPPLVLDPILHSPGNIVHLASWYTSASNTLGIHDGVGLLAREFQWHPPWLGGPDRVQPFSGLPVPVSAWWLAVPVVLIGCAWASARARGRKDLRILAEMLAVVLAAAFVGLAKLRGEPYAYLYYWRATVGSAVVVLSLFVLVEALDDTKKKIAARTLGAILVAALATSTVDMTRSVAVSPDAGQPMAPVAESILTQLSREHQPNAPVIVRASGTALGGLQGALVDELARRNDPVYVDKGLGYQFGYNRADPSHVKAVWITVEESELYSLYSQFPQAKVLATWRPLPASKMSKLVRLQRSIAAVLVADGRSDLLSALANPFVLYQLQDLPGMSWPDLHTLAALNTEVQSHVCVCAVIAFPPGAVPSPTSFPPVG
jgi:hypothetical protein